MKKMILTLLAGCALWPSLPAQENQVSKVWVADQGDGTYKNPVLYADYSDPDVCRVGDDFYLTSSSFGCLPGLQILHSKDLVNWRIVSAAIPSSLAPHTDTLPQHGNRVWAPCIRHHDGQFYIYWGDPDQGIFLTKANDVKGPWTEPVLVLAAKGVIDTTPLWDDDGKVYLAHAFAGSRAGLKSVIAVCELNQAGDKTVTQSRIVFDGHEAHETCEGPKFYKRNGYYYIFHPAGGVPTGWQVVLRSKQVYGPYEWRTVMAQGNSPINGPHQGAWVDTPSGEDWFLHFQDVGAAGRLVHLQPMQWVNDWPVIGIDADGDGCGEPVLTYRKPKVGTNAPVCTPQESDEFDSNELGLQWQWNANANPKWYFCDAANSRLRLYSYPVDGQYTSLWSVPNMLLQKFPAPSFSATMKLKFSPIAKYTGERTGLAVMGMDYAALIPENTENGLVLSQVECLKADKGKQETVHATLPLKNGEIYLRARITDTGEKLSASEGGHDHLVKCQLSYSLNGKKFLPFGKEFQVKEGKWIGAKVGMFCTRPHLTSNDGGWADIDWFRIEP